MGLLKRIKFAFKYNISSKFIVIPYGDKFYASNFLKYEDALEFAKKCKLEQPQFMQPEILVMVEKL